jgi:hypothetical protein
VIDAFSHSPKKLGKKALENSRFSADQAYNLFIFLRNVDNFVSNYFKNLLGFRLVM